MGWETLKASLSVGHCPVYTCVSVCVYIGGGFHHCWSNEGGGFCAYADITLCVKVSPAASGLSADAWF